MEVLRLLLVDDEEDFRLAASKSLTRRGFEVMLADSGESALEILAAGDEPGIDLMVLDLKMPGMDGIETLSELRQRDEDLPVIILTGHGRLADAVSGIRLGIVDFVQKPVDMDELARRIRRLAPRDNRVAIRELTISELMVPASRYHRLYADQPVGDVLVALRESMLCRLGHVAEQPVRTVLVYERDERFLGCVRIGTILGMALPDILKDSSYASYLTGMFVAQCKLVSNRRIRDIVETEPTIDVRAPLMEALQLMASRRLINLPVMHDSALIGMVRDKDLVREIANQVAGAPA